jgi:hypothetical protein
VAQSAAITVSLLLQAAIQCLAQPQPSVEEVAVFGTAPAKQARALQAAEQVIPMQMVIDIVYSVATALLDKDSQAAVVVDLIVKAIINMPAVVVVEQVVRAKMPAITDMNILRQTAVLAWHQTCWETYITLQAEAEADHTICLQAAVLVELVVVVAEHVITELH